MALANMLLSLDSSSLQIFSSRSLLARVVKLAVNNQEDNQLEVMALLRNLSYYPSIRPLLLKVGALEAVGVCQAMSLFSSVVEWCAAIRKNLSIHISSINGTDHTYT